MAENTIYAFPIPDVRTHDGFGIREGSPGMTLRDYAAIRMVPAVMHAKPDWVNYAAIAVDAYKFADVMLAARAGKPRDGEGDRG